MTLFALLGIPAWHTFIFRTGGYIKNILKYNFYIRKLQHSRLFLAGTKTFYYRS
jgi:hypothetical protein